MNRVALITGAGSGIGAEICRVLARDGVIVHGADVNLRGVEQTFESFDEMWPRTAHVCDVTDAQGVEAMVEDVVQRSGRLDIVVNAAGILERRNVVDTTDESWSRVIDVNLGGSFRVVRAATPHLIAASRGAATRVVNIGSGAADMGYAYPAYSASKGGVVSLTRALAAELAQHKITVNAVNPGFIQTEINRDLWSSEVRRRDRAAQVPIGRLGQASDIAELVGFLCSDRAGYITGQVIRVDGGSSAILPAPPVLASGSHVD